MFSLNVTRPILFIEECTNMWAKVCEVYWEVFGSTKERAVLFLSGRISIFSKYNYILETSHEKGNKMICKKSVTVCRSAFNSYRKKNAL